MERFVGKRVARAAYPEVAGALYLLLLIWWDNHLHVEKTVRFSRLLAEW